MVAARVEISTFKMVSDIVLGVFTIRIGTHQVKLRNTNSRFHHLTKFITNWAAKPARATSNFTIVNFWALIRYYKLFEYFINLGISLSCNLLAFTLSISFSSVLDYKSLSGPIAHTARYELPLCLHLETYYTLMCSLLTVVWGFFH